MNIVLCGFTGCGKSAVGKALSELTGKHFIDTDILIEQTQGMSPCEIFNKYGETYFRVLEANAVKEISSLDNVIIATGGGTVLSEETVSLLQSNGKIFFIDTDIEVILERLRNDDNKRTVIEEKSLEEVLKMYRSRLPIYEQISNFKLDASSSPEEIAKEIYELVNNSENDNIKIYEPYRRAGRRHHPANTVINVGNLAIGSGDFCIIAGPCSVESEEQLNSIASYVSIHGANIMRAGAYKPRTSPYAFQGLGKDGIAMLSDIKSRYHIPVISEIVSAEHLPLFKNVDILQVGARNMQNFELLKALGNCDKPVMLKRGMSNTIEETLMSAEYIMSGGNENVIICERGIRTFEPFTRSTLDLSAVPVFKKLSHLPVFVDPSHAAGLSWLVEPLALAAAAIGADGIMVEVHNAPSKSISDSSQALNFEEFSRLSQKVIAMNNAVKG